MDHTQLFGAATNIYLLGWVTLVFGGLLNHPGRTRQWLLIFGGRFVPCVLILLFAFLYIGSRDQPGSITSWTGLLTGFSQPDKLLGAWSELLALSLVIARWIIDDTTSHALPRWLGVSAVLISLIAPAFALVVYWPMRAITLAYPPQRTE